MSKIEINLSSTALSSSACILNLKRVIIGELGEDGKPDGLGGYKDVPKASAVYGVSVHKFIDTMFRTSGNIGLARQEANKSFNVPKIPPPEDKSYLVNFNHLFTTCYNVWTEQIEKEAEFELLGITQKCYWCKGERSIGGSLGVDCLTPNNLSNPCTFCNGLGVVLAPATEVTFRILIYEDEEYIIYLCGTLDSIGKFKNGCYAIRDWKTTSSWNVQKYLNQYRLSRQLRIYTLACKLEARNNPDSILGKIGLTNMGAFIDAIFLKPSGNDCKYERSEVHQFKEKEIDEFEDMLEAFCGKIIFHLRTGIFPKEGILNGSCNTMYGPCKFSPCCASNDNVASVILRRDFKRVPFNPLNYSGDE